MKFTIDHDYHIHSTLSACSNDPEQSTARLLQYALDCGLKRLCITDHFWDERVEGASKWYAPQNFEHISKAKPLPEADGVEFLFGCETEMDKFFTVGLSASRFDEFDFIIVPTTHLHMTGFTLSEEDAQSEERRAALWVERFERLLSMDLPFYKLGVAHLTCSLIKANDREGLGRVLNMISDETLIRLFTRAAELGCGIELNASDMCHIDEEAVLRIYLKAKECGCKFYLGSDAHHPGTFDRCVAIFEHAVEKLGLEESDKFLIKNK